MELRVRELRVYEVGNRRYDADAQNYFVRIELAGGSISLTQKEAINTFILAAKSHGYWNDLDHVNIFCGQNLTAAMVPLKIGGGGNLDIANGFDNGGDQPPFTFYSPGYGLKCNNDPSGYVDTGWNPSTKATNNSTHLAFYVRSQVADNAGEFGSQNTSRLSLSLPTTNGTYSSDQYDDTNGRLTTSSVNADAFIIATRTASNSHVVYRNGSSIGNNATNGGSLPNANVYVGALNNNGSGANHSKHTLGAYSLGLGLNGTKATDYSTDMEALQVALGRGTQDLANEDFERGVRPPNTFDNSSGFNYSASPISGTYSLRQVEGAYLVFFPPRIEEDEIHFKFRFKPELLPDPSSVFFEVLDATVTQMLALTLMLNGTVKVTGGGIDVSTVSTMSAGTTYYVWGYYKKGSGSNGEARVWFNTTDSRPANGSNNSAGATNGTQTATGTGMVLTCAAAANNNPANVFDEFRAKTVDFT
jgi:hypothetical protein